MIQKGKVVSLVYVLKDEENEELDRSTVDSPFQYIHGMGQIVAGLESALEGKAVGFKDSINVSPSDGYGEVNDQLVINLDRDKFPPNVELQLGQALQLEVAPGQNQVFFISQIVDNTVTLDGNHPLAGKTLHFEVEVIDVREPTPEELKSNQPPTPPKE